MNRKVFSPMLFFLLSLVMVSLACGLGTETKPSISVVAPPNNAQIAVGQTVEVQFRAEDAKAVNWVDLMLNDVVIATQRSPLADGQSPFEGILRWTPEAVGTYVLVLVAHNTDNQDSDPAAVSINVVEAVADGPTPTSIASVTPEGAVGAQPDQPSHTPTPSQADQPLPTLTPTGQSGQAAPTITPTPTTGASQSQPQPTYTPTGQPPTFTPTGQAPTHTPTSRAPTQTPTQQPTLTPTRTFTPIPMPEIVAFISDRDELYPGDCVTLQWTTRNATEIYLDQWTVAVPAGQHVVCYNELVQGSKGFRLTAANSRGSVNRDLYVQVMPPPETTMTAPFDAGRSGSVSSDGRTLPFVSPGDDGSNFDYEAFITFNIAGLPANATITSAVLQLGPCSTNGDPAGLGDHHLTNLQYGDLNPSDYAAGGAYITSVAHCPGYGIDVTSAVENMKAELYFQLRLYFNGSDFDGDVDDVTYSAPTLTITYVIL